MTDHPTLADYDRMKLRAERAEIALATGANYRERNTIDAIRRVCDREWGSLDGNVAADRILASIRETLAGK